MTRMRLIAVVLAVAPGCRQLFGIDDTVVADDGGDAGLPADAAVVVDGPPPDFHVAHLSPADEGQLTGTGDLVLAGAPGRIDTSALTITGGLPAGARFFVVQETAGSEIAVLDLASLTVGAMTSVTGSRALIVVANEITIDQCCVLDGSATGTTPGPGGSASDGGLSPGLVGSFNVNDDSGGGGGGFGGHGGSGGGSALQPGGSGGGISGDDPLTILAGGSGGASTTRSCRPGGGGGGALQLSARTFLRIEGGIDVGGGGGSGGALCTSYTSGGGGGAGGALYLQATVITGATGAIAANGGGGGGGGASATAMNGHPGGDAGLGTTAAPGGMPGGAAAGPGAPGGTGTMDAGTAISVASSNAGGGGGGVGRIVYRSSNVSALIGASPAAVTVPP